MDIQFKDLVLMLLGVVLGVLPSVLISRYYFKLSFKKSLTPYLMFHASPMSGMSPTVRDQMSIDFKGRRVQNLIEAQFVIFNDGDKAIRDPIQPLTLKWPEPLQVLDAEVVCRHPENLSVEPCPSSSSVAELKVEFELLNTREWFIIKVVADGKAVENQWQWSIVADELPRALVTKRLTLDHLSNLPISPRERLASGALAIGAGTLAIGLSYAVPLLLEWGTANASSDPLLSVAAATLSIASLILTSLSVAGAFELTKRAMQGFWHLRRALPNLPDDVIADVWRGYAAQADAVERLKKANTQ